jgi:hypothetical protein
VSGESKKSGNNGSKGSEGDKKPLTFGEGDMRNGGKLAAQAFVEQGELRLYSSPSALLCCAGWREHDDVCH